MIVELEDKYCKAGKIFGRMMQQLEADCEKEIPIHEAEERLWQQILRMGREMLAAFIGKQDSNTPTHERVELDGKTLRRLPERRRREYYSVFGKIEFEREVYATRETQRQKAVPLDAKLGMPEGKISYLLQRWCNMKSINNSYAEARRSMLEIFGFAPSVGAMEDAVSRAAEFADEFFDSQPAVDSATEEAILVATSDCKGVPMRSVDAPKKAKKSAEKSTEKASSNRRLGRGEKRGQKRMACVGGVYSVAPFRRTADDIVDEMLYKQAQERRPSPQNKRLRAELTQTVNGQEVNSKEAIFDWLTDEVSHRDPNETKTVVAIMDGEVKLRQLQEQVLPGAIGILDIWHVQEYLWKLGYCFYKEGSDEAQAFVDRALRGILEGRVGRVIGGLRQKMTKNKLPKKRREDVKKYLNYLAARKAYMKYDEYLAAGYPIGSGVVEGACKHLVKDRMEGSGMRWRISGAQSILSLRAIYLNDDWSTFWNHRITAEQAKKYPHNPKLTTPLQLAT